MDDYGESADDDIPTGVSALESADSELESADSNADSNAKVCLWVRALIHYRPDSMFEQCYTVHT